MDLSWIAPLVTLTVMEIVLGIDNIIFIAIVAGRLPEDQQAKARRLGLAFALITRLLLLFSITWLMGLTNPLFTLPHIPFFETKEAQEVTPKDLILLAGGLFLIFKSTKEIHENLEGDDEVNHSPDPAAEGVTSAELAASAAPSAKGRATMSSTIAQIMVIDIIFSLDSVITAVGMARELWVMAVAVIIAVGIMLVAADAISVFIKKHPTLKMLALSFLILIGVMLAADGLGHHIPRGYIYFAMGFSVVVEMLNIRTRSKREPVHLRRQLPVE